MKYKVNQIVTVKARWKPKPIMLSARISQVFKGDKCWMEKFGGLTSTKMVVKPLNDGHNRLVDISDVQTQKENSEIVRDFIREENIAQCRTLVNRLRLWRKNWFECEHTFSEDRERVDYKLRWGIAHAEGKGRDVTEFRTHLETIWAEALAG